MMNQFLYLILLILEIENVSLLWFTTELSLKELSNCQTSQPKGLVILLEMWKINNHSVYFLTPAAATICRRDHIDCQSVKKLCRPYRSMRVAGGGGTKSACLSKRLLRAGGGWEVQKVCSRRACGAVFQSYYIYHNLSKKLAKTVKNNIEIPALITLLCVFSF